MGIQELKDALAASQGEYDSTQAAFLKSYEPIRESYWGDRGPATPEERAAHLAAHERHRKVCRERAVIWKKLERLQQKNG